ASVSPREGLLAFSFAPSGLCSTIGIAVAAIEAQYLNVKARVEGAMPRPLLLAPPVTPLPHLAEQGLGTGVARNARGGIGAPPPPLLVQRLVVEIADLFHLPPLDVVHARHEAVGFGQAGDLHPVIAIRTGLIRLPRKRELVGLGIGLPHHDGVSAP